ncbi:hypothetical protein MCAG_00051 [Micromonospora sp. ATCC 39149]|uniref:Uncharacterized protein n=1 Tax=Micromonospora carbonacea TaxID=47853 RepID=A0A7D6CGP8_9ACTN|nr:hypothetical protein [Micromonospora sp. ATCC 39149]EEP69724.1 hypothetical protein MCAG_00051 [Micromonospora sp. ATCC 39149]QLK01054.1 hypothetical protein HZU44_14350 [Micromonospora carbonacea]
MNEPPSLADPHVSVAALLTAHALNVGFGPVIAGTDALARDRLAHVDQVVSHDGPCDGSRSSTHFPSPSGDRFPAAETYSLKTPETP